MNRFIRPLAVLGLCSPAALVLKARIPTSNRTSATAPPRHRRRARRTRRPQPPRLRLSPARRAWEPVGARAARLQRRRARASPRPRPPQPRPLPCRPLSPRRRNQPTRRSRRPRSRPLQHRSQPRTAARPPNRLHPTPAARPRLPGRRREVLQGTSTGSPPVRRRRRRGWVRKLRRRSPVQSMSTFIHGWRQWRESPLGQQFDGLSRVAETFEIRMPGPPDGKVLVRVLESADGRYFGRANFMRHSPGRASPYVSMH